MSASTLLLYTRKTGHVLAAATVAAPPNGEVDAEMLAGPLLPVDHLGDPTKPDFDTAQITVPADELLVLSVDAKAVPIDQARTHIVKLKEKTPTPLDPTKTITGPATPTANGFSVSFTSLSAEPTVVWARVEAANAGGSPPQTIATDVNPTGANQVLTVHVPLQALASGNYWTLVLVPGLVPSLSKITV